MQSHVDLTAQQPSPPPRIGVIAEDLYILATLGICWTWRGSDSGFYDKRTHQSLQSAMSVRQSNALTAVHFIDPVTAVTMRMIDVGELLRTNAYPEGYIALLNLLKIN